VKLSLLEPMVHLQAVIDRGVGYGWRLRGADRFSHRREECPTPGKDASDIAVWMTNARLSSLGRVKLSTLAYLTHTD